VRTDVESAELLVDGELYGAGTSGQWLLELPPGPHRLEAHAGGSVITSSTVTVRDGVPATVLLSMPEGASLAQGDGGATPTGELLKGPRGKRERGSPLADDGSERRARRLRERAAAVSDLNIAPVGNNIAVEKGSVARDAGALGREPSPSSSKESAGLRERDAGVLQAVAKEPSASKPTPATSTPPKPTPATSTPPKPATSEPKAVGARDGGVGSK
jgi:hypothetical protein